MLGAIYSIILSSGLNSIPADRIPTEERENYKKYAFAVIPRRDYFEPQFSERKNPDTSLGPRKDRRRAA